MELEQRIKSLEYEMQIMKNEMHRTLLEVQEQILIHYYPALVKSKELPPLPSMAQSLQAMQAQTTNSHPNEQTALSEWVANTITKIGAGRTGQLLTMYIRRASITPDAQDTLRQLTLAITAENTVGAVAVNEILTVISTLDELLGKKPNVEVALSIIEEANLG